jgi:hypothetical protein
MFYGKTADHGDSDEHFLTQLEGATQSRHTAHPMMAGHGLVVLRYRCLSPDQTE